MLMQYTAQSKAITAVLDSLNQLADVALRLPGVVGCLVQGIGKYEQNAGVPQPALFPTHWPALLATKRSWIDVFAPAVYIFHERWLTQRLSSGPGRCICGSIGKPPSGAV